MGDRERGSVGAWERGGVGDRECGSVGVWEYRHNAPFTIHHSLDCYFSFGDDFHVVLH